MYPTYPSTYEPVLTGRCPVNFSAISSIMEKTASDCNQPLAAIVGNVLCCPQFSSLLHIFQGFYSTSSDNLVLQNAAADDCFKDIVSILASRGANSSIPTICSTKSSNLTGGSCPVKDINTFEKTVNTSKLLEACSSIDPLKECCRPICQPVIMEAALKISGMQSYMNDNKNAVGVSDQVNVLNDCKGWSFHGFHGNFLMIQQTKYSEDYLPAKLTKVCYLLKNSMLSLLGTLYSKGLQTLTLYQISSSLLTLFHHWREQMNLP
ncbi:UNVERIFIED_CONTAM: putative GPI-anchored protein [Sesamum radiatum]|uniref:GPI-anchored protein n=1 Tax=Sesamum radiatum TaxID=300843 RepID=A0AAW2S8H3_SESRA